MKTILCICLFLTSVCLFMGCETVNPICNENYCVEIYPKSELPEGAVYDDLSDFLGEEMTDIPVDPLATVPDTDSPRVIGGTVRDGERDVDSVLLNTDDIEIIFDEAVSGTLALQYEWGEDVGWPSSVKGNTATLHRVAGKELGGETTYVISGKVSDAAGNETAISITFVTAWRPTPPHENLIDHWRFDERTDGIATNSIGFQDGEILGAKWTDGQFGYALAFDGIDDFMVVRDYATFGITANITFMVWFRPTDTLTNRAFIVKHDAFYVSFSEQEQLKFGVHPNDISLESRDTIRSEDYHFAVTFDGKTTRIYINGELNSEMPHDVPMAPSRADLVIGQGFAGDIDEVRIYNKALSEDEIEVAMEGADLR